MVDTLLQVVIINMSMGIFGHSWFEKRQYNVNLTSTFILDARDSSKTMENTLK